MFKHLKKVPKLAQKELINLLILYGLSFGVGAVGFMLTFFTIKIFRYTPDIPIIISVCSSITIGLCIAASVIKALITFQDVDLIKSRYDLNWSQAWFTVIHDPLNSKFLSNYEGRRIILAAIAAKKRRKVIKKAMKS